MVKGKELLHRVEDIVLLIGGDSMVLGVEEPAHGAGVVDFSGDFLAVFDVGGVDLGDVDCWDGGEAAGGCCVFVDLSVGRC